MPTYNDQGQVTGGDDLHTGLYADVADHIAPDPIREAGKPIGPKPAEPKPKDTGTSPAPPLKPGWPVLDRPEQIERFRAELAADDYHPARRDPELMQHYVSAEWRLSGKPVNEQGEPVDPETGETEEREVFANGQLRAKDAEAEAAALATLPAPPAGHTWDPIAHEALRALAADTPLVADAIEAGYPVVAAAQAMADRGVVLDELSWERVLAERWGSEAAQERHLDNAMVVLETLAADDEPVLRALAERLAVLWEWDPRIPIFLAEQGYRALSEGTIGDLVAEMLARGGERWAQWQSAARARAAKAAKADQTPDDHVVASGGRP